MKNNIHNMNDKRNSIRRNTNHERNLGEIENPSRRNTHFENRSKSQISDESQPIGSIIGRNTNHISYLNLDIPFPCLWTYGVCLLITISIIFEVIQSWDNLKSNPLYGPNEMTMLSMGAKSGELILAGESWRLFSAIILQNSITCYVLTIASLIYTKTIERKTGFTKSFFLFILSGTYGYIASCLFDPRSITCGTTGALFGYFGMLHIELITSWRHINWKLKFIKYTVFICVFFVFGTTTYVDNFSHLGGLLMGVLFSLMLLPNVGIYGVRRVVGGIMGFLAFPLISTIYMLSLAAFFRGVVDISWCKWCPKINCINVSGWCKK